MKAVKLEELDQPENAIVIITDVQDGTRGDIASTRKLIRAMREKTPTRPIIWLLRADAQTKVSNVPDGVELIRIAEWVEMFAYKNCVNMLKSAAFVAVYPAYMSGYVNEYRASVSILPVPVRVFIEHCREGKLPLTCILEYGYISSELLAKAQHDFPNLHFLQTGVMQNSCGIYLEDYSKDPPHRQLQKLPEHVKNLLGTELINQGAYFNHHALFVGYYNQSVDRAMNNNISAQRFVQSIAELSIHDVTVSGKSNVDILLPFSLNQVSELDMTRLGELGFSQVIFQSDNGKIDNFFIPDHKNRVMISSVRIRYFTIVDLPIKTLRIIQLPRMSETEFQALVAAAHPFVMCTGDQSLSEVLSKSTVSPISYGLPYYQIMHWKLNAFMEFYEQVKSVCGDEDSSRLTLFYKSILFNGDVSPKLLGEFLGSYSFCWDSHKFSKYLRKFFNLAENLPTYIEACISAKKMLPLYDVLRKPNSDPAYFLNDISHAHSFNDFGKGIIHYHEKSSKDYPSTDKISKIDPGATEESEENQVSISFKNF